MKLETRRAREKLSIYLKSARKLRYGLDNEISDEKYVLTREVRNKPAIVHFCKDTTKAPHVHRSSIGRLKKNLRGTIPKCNNLENI